MRTPTITLLSLALILLGSCGRKRATLGLPQQVEEVRAQLDAFTAYWLRPARIAPPTVEFSFLEIEPGVPISARAAPMLAEEVSWNQWPGDEARLFNNRAAYLFKIEVVGQAELIWVPERTTLENNGPHRRLDAARSPEEVLAPLHMAAWQETRWSLGDALVERTRAAGPFRAAYLPTTRQHHILEGVVAFPKADPEEHVVAMRLTVGVQVGEEVYDLVWVFD